MFRRRPQAVAIRLALAGAWLAVLMPVAGPAPALARTGAVVPSGLSAWMSDTAARALRDAEPDNDLAAGGRAALNHSVKSAFLGLQQVGPAWLRRVTLDLRFRDDSQIAYDIAAVQPLLRSWQHGDLLWLRGHFRHDPSGRNIGDLGLLYRPRVLDGDLTLGVTGAVEDRRLQGYRRFGVGATARSPAVEFSASLFDDVAGRQLAEIGVPDRRLDGYDMAIAAQVPGLPSARVQARKRWQVAVDGNRVSEGDALSLQFKPLAPLGVEAGTIGAGEQRSWFAKFRFKVRLGGGD
ncbi:MAG TPA: inverse autotransporter beta domain-containing protein [Geminicoccaceae bacterium]|nr:inverse autotransporter beta domain-containing protein [Geminicoccaceae bacterium]